MYGSSSRGVGANGTSLTSIGPASFGPPDVITVPIPQFGSWRYLTIGATGISSTDILLNSIDFQICADPVSSTDFVWTYKQTTQLGTSTFTGIAFDPVAGDPELVGWTHPTPSTFVCPTSGKYKVDYSASILAPGSGIRASIRGVIDRGLGFVEVRGSAITELLPSATKLIFSNPFIIFLQAGDTFSLQFISTGTGAFVGS